jgi:NAD(P)-dependent dehydrogenase (short-subunit alcohol dehydrogenase family)
MIRNLEATNADRFRFTWDQGIDLSGTTILAFGGGGNLAEVFLYAAAASGAQIAIGDMPPADPDKKRAYLEKLGGIVANISDIAGYTPLVLDVDVTDAEAVVAATEAAKERLGRIDIGIDFAGIHHRTFDLTADDPKELAEIFRRVIEVNVNGAFLATTALARVMVPQRKGHIIHLCSSGSRLSLYASYAYNASKHALEGIVKTSAAQLAPYGVRVNAIAPGTVITNLNRDLLQDEAGEYRPRAKSILAHTPTKRFLSREGIAETLLGMCVPQRHLTGNVIFADDGYNIEGHSWPDGNTALYAGAEELENLLSSIETPGATEARFPPISTTRGPSFDSSAVAERC